MKRNGWQRTWVRILTTVMTMAVMTFIFAFSSENAESSDQTSGNISRAVIPVVYPDYEQKPPEEKKICYDNVQHIVRKTAHFTEYLILGLLIRLCLESWFGRRKGMLPISWAAGTIYAGTDELHQKLIDGRSGQRTDVLLDSAGVMAGVMIAVLILYLSSKKRLQA